MKFLAFSFSLVVLAISVAAAPASNGPRVHGVREHANKIARAPMPIPHIAVNPHTWEILKRDDDKMYTFGGYKTTKVPGEFTTMKAAFNESAGTSWCNEIADVGKQDTDRNNILTAARVDSHVGWSNPGPDQRPPEYVCFFYESRGKCDPSAGHAEYVESVPTPVGGTVNATEFATEQYKYISWGCQWHPLNKKSTPGGTGWPA